MFLKALLLACIDRFHAERTVQAVYYLLTGKKSAQTIQDTAWYGLQKYFNIIPDLSKRDFDQCLNALAEQRLITIDKQTAQITSRGRQWYKDIAKLYAIPAGFNGFKYQQVEVRFWQRLSLLVQTLSHWSYGKTRFIPVQRDLVVQQEVKRWIYQMSERYDKKLLPERFSHELIQLLEHVEKAELQPELFVYRLSGYERSGLTPRQIAERLKLEEQYYQLLFRSILHQMIALTANHRDDFPLFVSLTRDLQKPVALTRSSYITYQLLQQGKTLAEIARERQLKKSTIEDHIVEIVLMNPEFSIQPYVSKSLQEKIISAVNRCKSRKLRRIKELVPEADYFSIRLVLSAWPKIVEYYH